MVLSYTRDYTSTSIIVGTKYATLRYGYEYQITRGYTRFDLSSYGFTLAQIQSVTWNIYVTTINGATTYRLRSAISTDSNWGATVDATSADFDSTTANIEVNSQTINTTGWNVFSVDKNNLDLSGMNYYRLAITTENGGYTKNVYFNSNNAGSNSPYLEVTTIDGGKFKIAPHAGI